ncbi:MAG: rRNA maturation RNase YbeY [Acidobacteriota bacterium]
MLNVNNFQKKYWLDSGEIRKFGELLEKKLNLKNKIINIIFTNNIEIKKLNKDYLKRNRTTDVISFKLNEILPDGNTYLGEIYISVPYAFYSTLKKKHGLEKELKILIVHGILHLIGMDHRNKSKRMIKIQNDLVDSLS